jgi:hypothetical protein
MAAPIRSDMLDLNGVSFSEVPGSCYDREIDYCVFSRACLHGALMMFSVSEKVGPTQRTLTNVNHKVTQRTKLIHDLPQTRCVLRCRVKSSCSEPGDMCVCYVLSTDFTFKSAKPVGGILDSALRRL